MTTDNTPDMMDPIEREIAELETRLASSTDPKERADLERRLASLRAARDRQRHA